MRPPHYQFPLRRRLQQRRPGILYLPSHQTLRRGNEYGVGVPSWELKDDNMHLREKWILFLGVLPLCPSYDGSWGGTNVVNARLPSQLVGSIFHNVFRK